MFMVLAIGSLMDTRLPSYNVEAEKYHQLARAALFQNSIFDEPTLGTVQALVSIFIPSNMGIVQTIDASPLVLDVILSVLRR